MAAQIKGASHINGAERDQGCRTNQPFRALLTTVPHKSTVPSVIKGASKINGVAQNKRPHESTVQRMINGAAQINSAARDQGCRTYQVFRTNQGCRA
jgi:hypothetical protein